MGDYYGNNNLWIANSIGAGIFRRPLRIHASKSKRKYTQAQLYSSG
jgi:hypothetical protein